MARDGLADMEHGGDVGLQQPLEGVGREILQRGAVLHAGVVHQDVDGPALCLERVHGGADGVVVGRVEGQRLGPGDARGGGGKLGRVAPVQHHLRARRGQTLRQRKADALRRPGDQRAPPGQIEKPVVPRSASFQFALDKRGLACLCYR